MTEIACPKCGYSWTPQAADIDPVEQLADWCRDRGLWVSLDGQEVRTAGAAALLNLSEQWLRQAACYFGDSPVPSRRVGRHRLWRLADIDAYLTYSGTGGVRSR